MFSSLRSRLLLSYALVVGVVLCVVSAGIFIYVVRNPLSQRQAFARLQRAADAIQSRQELLTLIEQRPQDAVLRIDSIYDARVLVLAPDGSVQADSQSGAVPDLHIFLPRMLDLPRGLVRDVQNELWIYVPVTLPNGGHLVLLTRRVGLVQLLFSQRLREILRDDLFPTLLRAGLVALLVALLLAFLISRSIANPLQRMARAARGVANGEHQPIPVQGPQEIKELAAAFNEMSEQVQASQQSQRDFVANVSHELKTPLTSIQGFSQAILDGTADTPQSLRQAAEVIHDESGRMHRMVLELLDLARLDSGIAEIERQEVDLTGLLNSVAARFAPLAEHASVTLKMDLGSLPPLVGDPDRLSQVFLNLLDNALKYSPAGETIQLRARQLGDIVEVSVEDHGPGIAGEEVGRIFERFYQTDKTRPGGAGRGVGLGLTIANEIIQAHQGSITVFSNTDQGLGTQGSIFVVKLPLARTADKAVSEK